MFDKTIRVSLNFDSQKVRVVDLGSGEVMFEGSEDDGLLDYIGCLLK